MVKYNLDFFIDKTLGPSGETEQHLMTMFSLVLSLRARNILDLGVGTGWSTMSFLVGAHFLGDGKVTSVDILDTGFRPPDYLARHWTFHQENALDFLARNQTTYDLIMVDDWHAGDHVYTELKLIEPYAPKSTMILLHDLMYGFTEPEYNDRDSGDEGQFAHQGPYGGVKRFVAEHPEFEFCTIPVSHGLTLMRRAR